MTVVPIIISGGAGSRLWPLSRETFPKPFVTLPDGETLLRKTYARALALPGVTRVVTVTNRELTFLTSDEYERVPEPVVEHGFILEPSGRDTAAAIALGALHVAETEGPDALFLMLPADHLIGDVAAFVETVARAEAAAAAARIVLFGIRPDRPETGFGYFEAGGDTIRRFVEKPDAATAARYLESGRYFWNSGMLCAPAGLMLDALSRHRPDIMDATRAAYEASVVSTAPRRVTVTVDREAFARVPATSIDYAVLEREDALGFVEAGFDWSDVGSWTELGKLVPADDAGNRFSGTVVAHDAHDTFVLAQDRLVGLVGVRDLIVVDTPDALMIADRSRAGEVRGIYDRLKAADSPAAILHRTAHRPWGTYTVLEEGDRFKIKRIEVKPGARLSLQAHYHRSEHWVVVHGTARVQNGEDEMLLSTNESTYIPYGHRHRLENPGKVTLVMIEVQSGDYIGEDDIVRFDDVYGRGQG